MSLPPYLLAGGLALLVTYAITYEMRWLAERLGAVTQPGGRHIHDRPIPRMGGLAIFGGVMLALLLTLPIDQPISLSREPRQLVLAVPYTLVARPLLGILLGAVAMTVLGAVDDM